jgi:hypothetical protein
MALQTTFPAADDVTDEVDGPAMGVDPAVCLRTGQSTAHAFGSLSHAGVDQLR